ncbi:hypothetical protein [Ornithinimicrobium ciconiae]|nr:hypothetical protein [Ornithinimicrobium ciconiae]
MVTVTTEAVPAPARDRDTGTVVVNTSRPGSAWVRGTVLLVS